MIKNYKQFESLLNKLEGPSEKEVSDELRRKYINREIGLEWFYNKSKELGIKSGVSNEEITNELKRQLNSGEISKYDYYTKLKKYGLLNFTESELWKFFGFNRTFNTYDDFLDYMFSDLKIIKRPDYPNCFFYTKDDKIVFEVDPNNHRINVEYFDIWFILIEIFNENDSSVRYILKEEITKRFNIYKGFHIVHMSNLVNSRWWWNEKNHRDYKKVTESLLNKLTGPTEEEIWNNFEDIINITNPNELLVFSALIGSLKGTKIALEKGANVSVSGEQALRTAASNGFLNIVKCLVENGANIHIGGDTVFKYACEGNDLEMVKYLVEQGADITMDKYYGLKYARMQGYTDIVEYLEDYMKKNGLKESVLTKLEGPSEEEIFNNYKNNKISLADYLLYSSTYNFKKPSNEKIINEVFNKEIETKIETLEEFLDLFFEYAIKDTDTQYNLNNNIIFIFNNESVILSKDLSYILMVLFKINMEQLKAKLKRYFDYKLKSNTEIIC